MAKRVLSLVKGEHRFIFNYQKGQEDRVMDAMASLAKNHHIPFDWSDASVLHFQLRRRQEQASL